MSSPRSLLGRRCAAWILFGAAALLTIDSVHAASPSFSSITPPGGRRGTDVEVRIGGTNLGDDPQLVLYQPGITVKKIEPLKDKAGNINPGVVLATLAVAPDCRMGAHAMRMRTSSGLSSSLVLFSVGAMEETAEVEPNNEIEKAQPVAKNVTISGTCGTEDVEYYAIEAKKGEQISAEVEGLRLGRVGFDPFVTILDSNRKELARSDDAALGWYDAVTSVIAPTDGTYYVMLRESTFGGGGAQYRIHIGNYPRPTGVIPAGGKPGQKMEVTFLGETTGPWKQTITVPQKPEFYSTMTAGDQKGTALFAQNERGISPSPLIFRVNDLDNVLETEPNEDPQSLTPVAVPGALNGIIEKPGDVDHFVFSAKKGQVFDVRVHARSVRSPLDSVLTVTRRTNNAAVGTNDDSGSPDSYLRVNCGADEDYVIQVKDMLGEGGSNYVYRVEVTPVEPFVAATVAEKVQYIDTVVAVPQGNHGAVVLNISRKDFAADLALKIASLPKGLKYETIPITAGQTLVPLLLSADANAPLDDAILDVRLNSTDPSKPASGYLSQTSGMVRINNRPVYEHVIQRLSGAVTKKAPFRIEVAEPKVPLVRSGTMDLKVRAIREPGFTAPINIRLLYAPNGTAGAVSAQIPEGQNEGTLLISAAPTAEIKEWKIIVLGSATVDGGNLEVASPFVKLQVGEPFFDLAFKTSSVEQGKELQFTVQTTNNIEFGGNAKLQLIGLPNEATCDAIQITKDSTQAVFTVKTTTATPVGRHKAIMCSLIVTQNGEPINHTLGPAEIRVDPPVRVRPKAVGAESAVSQAKPSDAGAKTPSTTAAGNNK